MKFIFSALIWLGFNLNCVFVLEFWVVPMSPLHCRRLFPQTAVRFLLGKF
ncbi:hypothetical protein SLEP1_g22334 [Rubroshorea leprosula]|uniref:Uncharacterized protein n=1 Tax=Rubroshorea leprosula TaxID=152421 RepID=A0AAV5J8W0_9ROSI|nr:hypothetical protein SLEP1_g22334 [Rubroshorea leprosula]